MQQDQHEMPRATCARVDGEEQPRAQRIDDSSWLVGDAMVTPCCCFDLRADHEIIDPVWLAI